MEKKPYNICWAATQRQGAQIQRVVTRKMVFLRLPRKLTGEDEVSLLPGSGGEEGRLHLTKPPDSPHSPTPASAGPAL